MADNHIKIDRLAVIGVGLIGGSLARALRQAQAVGHVVGCGRDPEHLELAKTLGVIDEYQADPAAAAEGADIIALCVPVGAVAQVAEAIKPALTEEAIVTDVGSTKVSVIEAMRSVFDAELPRFVPGHPIAGTERSGVGASQAGLFEHRRVILTPTEATESAAVDRIAAMWRATGAVVTQMQAAHHDQVLAATSHMPHLLAYALVDSLAAMEERMEIFAYAAGGFRDFTRIASSSPQMWVDIMQANREAILQALEAYTGTLDELRQSIEREDYDAVLARFRGAKAARDRLIGLAEPGSAVE